MAILHLWQILTGTCDLNLQLAHRRFRWGLLCWQSQLPVIGLSDAFLGWPERGVAFRWGSVASSVFVTLQCGVHLILANPPWRQLQERAEKIPGDKKHVEGMLSQSHCGAQFNTAHKVPGSGPLSPGKALYRTSPVQVLPFSGYRVSQDLMLLGQIWRTGIQHNLQMIVRGGAQGESAMAEHVCLTEKRERGSRTPSVAILLPWLELGVSG